MPRLVARGFVDKQPSSIRMGVVAFGGSGLVVQQPTTDKNEVLSAINRLAPQGDTAIGRGILTSLGAIAGKVITAAGDTEGGSPDETPIGYYGGTAIVMLTDGENTDEPDPSSWLTSRPLRGCASIPSG
jgi:Ca-activated chloride channel family protein